MSYKLREDVTEYSVLWKVRDAFQSAPTLSLFQSSALNSLGGMVQTALTVQEDDRPFALRKGVEEVGNAWWWIHELFSKNVALSMLNKQAREGIISIAIEALYERVEDTTPDA